MEHVAAKIQRWKLHQGFVFNVLVDTTMLLFPTISIPTLLIQ
jgi:hypothetical protein